jgi:glycosyltransferase involved in cell wall biosynthesis
MKIMQVLLREQIGGAETLASQLEAAWVSKGHGCITVYLDEDDRGGVLARLRKLRRAAGNECPDVVVSHSALPNLYARIACPCPVVTVLHSASDDFANSKLRLAERLLLRRTAAVVAVAALQAGSYVQRFPQAARRLVVINNGVGLSPREITYSHVPRHVVTTARFAEQKNPALWASVSDKATADGVGLEFRWWGPMASDPRCEEVLASIGIGARYCGPTSEVGKALDRADIYFHPSHREAFSIGILEAAAYGLPIVCSESVADGLPVELRPWTFRDDDADSALAQLRNVVGSWRDATKIAREAAAWVGEHYSMESCSERYLHLLRQVTETR